MVSPFIPNNEISSIQDTPRNSVKQISILRENSRLYSFFGYIKEGSSTSSVSILLSSSLGSTIVQVPLCIYELGLYLGVFLLLLSMLINCFTSYCLILVSDKTGCITYKGIGDALFGAKYGILFESIMVISCYLKIMMYLILLGSIIAHNFESGVEAKHVVWYMFIVILIFPMALMRNISKLRYFVILTIAGSVMYSFIIICETFYYISLGNRHIDSSLFTKSPIDSGYYKILKYFVLFLVSFSCQTNVLSVYEEIEYKSVRKGLRYVVTTYIILTSLYLFLGIIGSLILFDEDSDFYNTIKENNSIYPIVSYNQISISFFIIILGKFHLRLFPCRDGIYSIVWPEDLIIPNLQHIGVCITLLASIMGLAYFTEFILEKNGYRKDDSFRLYAEGFAYVIDFIVRDM
jgi:amino acid permease